MALFTICIEFAGGTYLSQVRASGPSAALRTWATTPLAAAIPGLGPAGQRRLVAEIERQVPVAVAGLAHVWCSTATVRGSLALIHVVRTAAAPRRRVVATRLARSRRSGASGE